MIHWECNQQTFYINKINITHGVYWFVRLGLTAAEKFGFNSDHRLEESSQSTKSATDEPTYNVAGTQAEVR